MGRYDRTIQQRFDEKWIPVPESGCWLWTAALNQSGYGLIGVPTNGNFKTNIAHRVSWEFKHGPIPIGLCVLHKCDIPSCVNPDHLFLGTNADNVADRDAKGRNNQPHGVKSGKTYLTEDEVRTIRAAKGTCVAIAQRFGIPRPTVWCIRSRSTWKYLDPDPNWKEHTPC